MNTLDGHDRRAAADLVAELCQQVSSLLIERGVLSCVFGSRLLLNLLTDARIEAKPAGVGLTIADPLRRAVFIGDTTGFRESTPAAARTTEAEVPGGFPGHVVVLAKADGRVHLLDPTAFQAIRFWSGLGMEPPLRSVVLRLGAESSLLLDEEASFQHQGWTYEYTPEPNLDWSGRHEWVGTDRHRLDVELRRRVRAATGVDLVQPSPPGRNQKCPCGSGKKYKSCCGLAA